MRKKPLAPVLADRDHGGVSAHTVCRNAEFRGVNRRDVGGACGAVAVQAIVQAREKNPHCARVRVEDVVLPAAGFVCNGEECGEQAERVSARKAAADLLHACGFKAVCNPSARRKDGHVVPARGERPCKRFDVGFRAARFHFVGQHQNFHAGSLPQKLPHDTFFRNSVATATEFLRAVCYNRNIGGGFMKITLNPDAEVVRTVKEGLARTGGYCPCRLARTEENKCMCREFREQIKDPDFEGYCHCMLYYKSKD